MLKLSKRPRTRFELLLVAEPLQLGRIRGVGVGDSLGNAALLRRDGS